jgi:hypothetical protein
MLFLIGQSVDMEKSKSHRFLRYDLLYPKLLGDRTGLPFRWKKIAHHPYLFFIIWLKQGFASWLAFLLVSSILNWRWKKGRQDVYYINMKYQLSLLVLAFAILIKCTDPTWSYIPSLRAGTVWPRLGQVECVTSLMTSEDTSPTITDTSFNYYQSITGSTDVTQLRYGISLISYESWMTDTFSFNISMVNCTYTGAKIRFQVLDNTFFTKVKVHYIVIWALSPNIGTGASALYNMEIIYGCTFQFIEAI